MEHITSYRGKKGNAPDIAEKIRKLEKLDIRPAVTAYKKAGR